MKQIVGAGTIVAWSLWCIVAGLAAQEQKIAIDKLPKAVLDAVNEKYPKAKLESAVVGKVDGKAKYEVTLKFKGYCHDVTLSEAGKILQVEKEIKASDLPRAVSAAVNKKYPESTIHRVEEVTKGTDVAFEVLLTTAQKKKLEVYLDPKGKIVDEKTVEEPKKEKKDK